MNKLNSNNKINIHKLPDNYPDSTTIGNSVRNTHLDHHHHLSAHLKETRQFALRPNSRRKRLCSSSSQLSNNESLVSAADERERRNSSTHRKRRKGIILLNSLLNKTRKLSSMLMLMYRFYTFPPVFNHCSAAPV